MVECSLGISGGAPKLGAAAIQIDLTRLGSGLAGTSHREVPRPAPREESLHAAQAEAAQLESSFGGAMVGST